MMQSKAKYILVFVVACFFFINQVVAQGGGAGPPSPNPAPGDIPIDGGVLGLLLAGLGYGARKLYMQNKDEDAAN